MCIRDRSVTVAFFASSLTTSVLVANVALVAREARWGVSPLSTVLGKFAVFGPIAVAQGSICAFVFLQFRDGPRGVDGVAGPLALCVSLSLLALASASVGLLASSLSRGVDQMCIRDSFGTGRCDRGVVGDSFFWTDAATRSWCSLSTVVRRE